MTTVIRNLAFQISHRGFVRLVVRNSSVNTVLAKVLHVNKDNTAILRDKATTQKKAFEHARASAIVRARATSFVSKTIKVRKRAIAVVSSKLPFLRMVDWTILGELDDILLGLLDNRTLGDLDYHSLDDI